VIWGWYNGIGIQSFVEAQDNQTVFGETRAIITPTPLAFYFIDDIPAQSAYLGLLTIGLIYVIPASEPDLRQAISFFDTAIDVIERTTTVTNPWEGEQRRIHMTIFANA
jgi:hypothetical protein